MKCISATLAALAAFAACSQAVAEYIQDNTENVNTNATDAMIDIPFVDDDVYSSDPATLFVDDEVYSTDLTTASGDFDNDNDDAGEDGRQLQVVESVVAAFTIASAIAPLISGAIQNNKKECQQVACWISTNSRTCAIGAAERTQAKIMKGRDRYRYESIQRNGMWARYWRTKFEPVDRGNIATGKCTDGARFTVTNCQSTGSVHC